MQCIPLCKGEAAAAAATGRQKEEEKQGLINGLFSLLFLFFGMGEGEEGIRVEGVARRVM